MSISKPNDRRHALRAISMGLLSISFGAAGMTVLRAQAGAAPQNPAAGKRKKLDVLADSLSDVSATGIQTLSGNVRIASDATVMRTAFAQYNTKTGVAVAPGKIQIDDERNTLVGNSGTAYYTRRDAVIQGAVKIVVRPKSGSASAPEGSVRREFKDPITVYCDRVDYNWRTRIAVATGNLTLKQNTKDGIRRTATAKKLTFYARDERVVLEGDVNAKDSKGQTLKGPIATAIIREGAEQFLMSGGTAAEIYVEDEDEPATPADPATVPSAPDANPGTPAPPTVPVPTPDTPGSTPAAPPSAPPALPVPSNAPKGTPLP